MNYKLKRDYIKNPLQKIPVKTPTGYTFEKPYKEDLEYLYITLNYSTKELQGYFGLTRRVIQKLLKDFGIKKSKEKRLENSIKKIHQMSIEEKQKSISKVKKTKLERYGNENFNNRNKCKETCLKIFGVENVNQRHLPKETIEIVSSKDKLEKYIKDNNVLNATELGNKLNISEPQIARYIVNYELKYLFNYSKSYIEKELLFNNICLSSNE